MDFVVKNNKLLNLGILFTLVLGIMGGISAPFGIKAYLIPGGGVIIYALVVCVHSKRCFSNICKPIVLPLSIAFIFFFASIFFSALVIGCEGSTLIKFSFLFLLSFSLLYLYYLEYIDKKDVFIMCSVANVIICIFVVWGMASWGWENIYEMNVSGAVQSGNEYYSTYIYKVFYTPPFTNSQNYVSSYIVSLMGVGIGVLQGNKKVKNIFWVIFSVMLGTFVVIFSLSKTAILGLAILMVFLVLSRPKAILYFVGGLLVVAAFNPLAINNAFLSRFDVVDKISFSKNAKLEKTSSDKERLPVADNKHNGSMEIITTVSNVNTVVGNKKVETSGHVDFDEVSQVGISDNTTDSKINDNSLISRAALWKKAMGLIKIHPIMGNGLRTTRLEFANAVPDDPHVNHPHNLYLQIMVDQGLIGLVVFIFACFYMLSTLIKAIKENFNRNISYLMVLAVLVFHFCRGAFGFQLEEIDSWLLFSVIMMIAVDRNSRKVRN